ncbi:hypothetical protein [Peribacillus frigoritolerans]|uniref:hypothetical protein n=1 Tax=Peribacillus frigoritolerans TaxID=450367 RepID=UPI00399FCFF9
MKKVQISILITVLFLTLAPINSFASSLENLPRKLSTNQWSVEIGKPDSPNRHDNKSDNPELYNVYSMDIKNIGDKNVKLVRVEAYRDDPNSQTAFELFTTESDKNLTPSFHHNNFPLFTKATKLIVTVTWTKESGDKYPRKFQEHFFFNQ